MEYNVGKGLSRHFIKIYTCQIRTCKVAQMVKNLSAMRETWVESLGWENLLEEGMATHSSILVWRSPMDRGTWWSVVHGVTKSQT